MGFLVVLVGFFGGFSRVLGWFQAMAGRLLCAVSEKISYAT